MYSAGLGSYTGKIQVKKIGKGGDKMISSCPLAYPDTCQNCTYNGTCSPTQAVVRIEELKQDILELKELMQKLISQQVKLN